MMAKQLCPSCGHPAELRDKLGCQDIVIVPSADGEPLHRICLCMRPPMIDPFAKIDPLDELDDIPHAHASDPWQSQYAADNLSTVRRHCLQLLRVYRTAHGPLTDSEAAELAGVMQDGQQAGKRCSDLRKRGWIEWVRDDNGKIRTRNGPSNRPRGLCVITPKGLAALAATVKVSA